MGVVVYFDQLLGAAHPKSWSKSSFSAKKAEKMRKKQEICCKIHQKTRFLSLHQNAGLLFYSQKNEHLECAAPKRWSKYTTGGAELCTQICHVAKYAGFYNMQRKMAKQLMKNGLLCQLPRVLQICLVYVPRLIHFSQSVKSQKQPKSKGKV